MFNQPTSSLNGTATADESKLPPEDLDGRPQTDTLDTEHGGKESGVRRIRAGRVIAAAVGVGTVATLALGYGLSPPAKAEAKPAAVKIDVRKQQGELPSPPALATRTDLNYATATQPPKAQPTATTPAGYASLIANDDESAPQTAGGAAEDEAVAEMRRQHAALRDELAAAQAQLAQQMEQTRQDIQAQQERQQAALDAPIGFDVERPSALAAPSTSPDDSTRAGSGVGGPLNPVIVAGDGGVVNPNEVQPEGTRSNLQTEKIAFLKSAEDGLETYLRTGPTGPVRMTHELSAGSVIPGFTVTALSSDLPGKVVGRVSSDVYDSATGRHVLIPQGSVAVGEYSSLVSNGQNRLLIAWEMLTFPDGRSIDLQRQPGTDASGASGLSDRVDYHWDKLALAGGISTAVAIGGELAEGDNSGFGQTEDVGEQLRELIAGGASDTTSRIANKIIDRQLDVQPTITVRPGWRFNILLTRNLVVEPYEDNRVGTGK
jgi:type IV secretion system protein VirB10